MVFGTGLNYYRVSCDFCSLLELMMMNADSHFRTLRNPLFMYTILFTLSRSSLEQQIELVFIGFNKSLTVLLGKSY